MFIVYRCPCLYTACSRLWEKLCEKLHPAVVWLATMKKQVMMRCCKKRHHRQVSEFNISPSRALSLFFTKECVCVCVHVCVCDDSLVWSNKNMPSCLYLCVALPIPNPFWKVGKYPIHLSNVSRNILSYSCRMQLTVTRLRTRECLMTTRRWSQMRHTHCSALLQYINNKFKTIFAAHIFKSPLLGVQFLLQHAHVYTRSFKLMDGSAGLESCQWSVLHCVWVWCCSIHGRSWVYCSRACTAVCEHVL